MINSDGGCGSIQVKPVSHKSGVQFLNAINYVPLTYQSHFQTRIINPKRKNEKNTKDSIFINRSNNLFSDNRLVPSQKIYKNSFNETSLESNDPKLLVKSSDNFDSLTNKLDKNQPKIDKAPVSFHLNGKEVCLVRVDNNVNVYRYKEDINK